MSIKELKEELAEIITLIPATGDKTELEESEREALEIINKLKDHINDDIEHNNETMTTLDLVIRCDSHGYDTNGPKRIKNEALLKIEQAIKNAGGKTSEELGRNLNSHVMEEATAFEVATAAAVGVVGVAAAVVAVAINRARINTARVGTVLLMAGFASELLKDSGTNLENSTIEQPHRQSPQI